MQILALAYGLPWIFLFCIGVPVSSAVLTLRWADAAREWPAVAVG